MTTALYNLWMLVHVVLRNKFFFFCSGLGLTRTNPAYG